MVAESGDDRGVEPVEEGRLGGGDVEVVGGEDPAVVEEHVGGVSDGAGLFFVVEVAGAENATKCYGEKGDNGEEEERKAFGWGHAGSVRRGRRFDKLEWGM